MPVNISRVCSLLSRDPGPGLSRAHYIFGGSGGIPGEEHLAGKQGAASRTPTLFSQHCPAQQSCQSCSANAVQCRRSGAAETVQQERCSINGAAEAVHQKGPAPSSAPEDQVHRKRQHCTAPSSALEVPTLSSTTAQWKRALELYST